jgi:hypothetical protein
MRKNYNNWIMSTIGAGLKGNAGTTEFAAALRLANAVYKMKLAEEKMLFAMQRADRFQPEEH